MTPTKTCSVCFQSKPWTDYWAAARWPDGSMRRPQYRCKECVKAALRQRRRSDPEWARGVNRKDWARAKARMAADGAYAVRRREDQRERSQVFRVKQREAA